MDAGCLLLPGTGGHNRTRQRRCGVAFPRWVLTTGYFTWPPGASVASYVLRGTLVDVPPGSALEAAYAVLGLSPVLTASQLGDDSTADRTWTAN